MTNPLAPVERAQKILDQDDVTLASLEAAKAELRRVVETGEDDLREIEVQRKVETVALTPAEEWDRKLDALDRREKEVVRRVKISKSVLAALDSRIDAAFEAERAAARVAEYDETEKLVSALASKFEKFLDRVVPEARALLADYAAAQQKVGAVNRNLPLGASPIRSLEERRIGDPQTRRTVLRQFKAFYRGADRIGEVGRYEALQTGDGIWQVFIPSSSIQGGEVVGGCRVVDLVDVRIETLKSQPESLTSALQVPEFYAPLRSTGSVRRTMPLTEWQRLEDRPVLALAAE
jgi:hypothetical protein